MKTKKILLLSLPIIAGVGMGQIFLKPFSPSSSPKPYEQEIPTGRINQELAGANLSSAQTVSHYLLQSQSLLSKAIEISSQNKDASQNEQVVKLINEAITQATQAIIASPQDARGYAQRGKIYQVIEKYLEEALLSALKDYQQAVRLDPHQLDYYRQIGSILTALDRPAQALSSWQKAAYLNPTDPQAWHELAKLQTKLGHLKEAQKSLERILSLVVDSEQKKVIEKEVAALSKLLVQAGEQPKALQPSETQLVLPDQPPQLEAKIAKGVIIADPQEKADSYQGEDQSNAFSAVSTLPSGETSLKITNEQLTPSSQIYLAALDKADNQVLRIKSKGADYFEVEVGKPLEQELEFRWWIIN